MTLKPAAAAVAGVARMGLDGRDDLVAFIQLAARRVVGPGNAGLEVGGVRPAAGLEDESVHARQFAQCQVEAVDDLEQALQGVRMLQRVHSAHLGPRGTDASDTAGLYFIVQVPNRLMPIMPSVC